MPAEFVGRSEARDVDGDGRDDLVMTLPALRLEDGTVADFEGLPPAVVAHRLEDGRYALDDEVTRAALRALCPAPPSGAGRFAGARADDGLSQAPYVEALFLEGLCQRVYGSSVADALTRLRAQAQEAAAVLTPAVRDVVATALAAMPVPLTLASRVAPPLAPLPPDASAPTPRAVAAPVAPACAAVVRDWTTFCARAQRAIDAHTQATMRPTLPRDDAGRQQCLATPSGRWAITPLRPTITGDDDILLAADAQLGWSSASGGPPPTPLTLALSAREYNQVWPSLQAAADYDGDGVPEAIVDDGAWQFEGRAEQGLRVFTARGGRVEPFASAEALRPIVSIEDADRDGRPDLVLPSPWMVWDHCGHAGIPHAGPLRLAHALADGSFSTTDAVARDWMRGQCVRSPADTPAAVVDVMDVACARLRGEAPEDIVAAMHARWPAGLQRPVSAVRDGLCLTFQEVASMVLVAVPVFER